MSGKVGRPPLNNTSQLKFTVTEDMFDSIDGFAKFLGLSKSEVLRKLVIPVVSGKTIEEITPKIMMHYYNKISDEVWDKLHVKNVIFDTENTMVCSGIIIDKLMGTVFVRYPTYSVDVYHYDRDLIRDTLYKVSARSLDSGLKNIRISNRIVLNLDKEVPMYKVSIVSFDIDEIFDTKDHVVKRLNSVSLPYSVLPDFIYRGERIDLIDSGRYFKVIY